MKTNHEIGDPVMLRHTPFSGTITRIKDKQRSVDGAIWVYSAWFSPLGGLDDFYEGIQFISITEAEFLEYEPTSRDVGHPKTRELFQIVKERGYN